MGWPPSVSLATETVRGTETPAWPGEAVASPSRKVTICARRPAVNRHSARPPNPESDLGCMGTLCRGSCRVRPASILILRRDSYIIRMSNGNAMDRDSRDPPAGEPQVRRPAGGREWALFPGRCPVRSFLRFQWGALNQKFRELRVTHESGTQPDRPVLDQRRAE